MCQHSVPRRRRVDRARPKSSTFTMPSSRTLIFPGLRSRWTMPCWWAASSASATCRAVAMALVRRSADPQPVGKRRALDQFEHQAERRVGRLIGRFDAVDGADVRVIQRGEDLRLAPEARGTRIG